MKDGRPNGFCRKCYGRGYIGFRANISGRRNDGEQVPCFCKDRPLPLKPDRGKLDEQVLASHFGPK